MFILLGVIIFYELFSRATTYFNKKYGNVVPDFEPSVNKLFFFFIGYFIMAYYSNYSIYHILFLGFSYFIVYNTELNKAIDFIFWKAFKFKSKKQKRIEEDKLKLTC